MNEIFNQDHQAPTEPPKIEVGFDPERQIVGLKFDSRQFKTWDYVIGVLTMAVEQARKMDRMAQMQAMQQQAQLQAQEAHIRRIIK